MGDPLPRSDRAGGPVRPPRRPGERGSTLLLFPVGLMVLMVLGAIAVDAAGMHLARRSALRAAGSAAEDAASIVDLDLFSETGTLRLEPVGAETVARQSLAVASLPGELVGTPHVVVDPDELVVTVTVTVRHDRFLGPVVGGAGAGDITVTALGRLEDLR